MIRFIVRLFALIGLLVVLAIVGGGYWIYQRLEDRPDLPESIVLQLDLDKALAERAPDDPFGLLRRETSLRDVVEALDRAARDPRVKGVAARIGGDQFGLAEAQELRAAVGRFRAAGRFAIAYSETFGEFGPGNVSYYLASAFDEIWLQPVGMVGLTGMVAQVPLARGALDKLAVVPELGKRAEYKTFANTFTETGLTPAHRQMMEELVGDLTGQLVSGIADGRRMGADALRVLLDRGPFLDREAVEARLVDRLGYPDEALAAARERAGSGTGLVGAPAYLDVAGRPNVEGPKLALVVGTGTIVRGESEPSPFGGGSAIAADTISDALDKASRDPAVRAILLRIDSGGGSAVASETIRRAVVRARQAGKPVVVSMGGMAASGGYWIALGADRIVALPATLTGSIGVVAGKMATEGFWEQLGITWGVIGRGQNATMWSQIPRYTPSELQRRDAMLDDIYGTFTGHVAEARKLSLDSVREIAKGRVWTGAQAQALGLVDVLGGYEVALAEARQLGGIPAGSPVTVELFPRPRNPLRQAMDLLAGRAEAAAGLAEALAPLARAAAILESPATGPATAPETGLWQSRTLR
ncbi:signal peptide peptidase SppA [Arenibaculum pallidiluteum]|uniref:signal peptide peptidase SppA n=1 Tax=Arenibaculum pallidiluteum TaxID=2812559 RepID=UPI001A95E69C|nr:signal peptide peptidase SppA [Arenibaculum pallidiluteum]